jgi:hypothetical protein
MVAFRSCLLAALAAACVMPALAGPYDQPYAIVEAGDRSEVREEFPPSISQVDGKSTRNTRRSDPIEPGKHRITVRFETARVTQSPAEVSRELDMDLEACTRYRVVAHRKGKSTDWEPKVYPEKIGECVRKFKKPS